MHGREHMSKASTPDLFIIRIAILIFGRKKKVFVHGIVAPGICVHKNKQGSCQSLALNLSISSEPTSHLENWLKHNMLLIGEIYGWSKLMITCVCGNDNYWKWRELKKKNLRSNTLSFDLPTLPCRKLKWTSFSWRHIKASITIILLGGPYLPPLYLFY